MTCNELHVLLDQAVRGPASAVCLVGCPCNCTISSFLPHLHGEGLRLHGVQASALIHGPSFLSLSFLTGNCSIAQAGLNCPPASASRVLRLQDCVTCLAPIFLSCPCIHDNVIIAFLVEVTHMHECTHACTHPSYADLNRYLPICCLGLVAWWPVFWVAYQPLALLS